MIYSNDRHNDVVILERFFTAIQYRGKFRFVLNWPYYPNNNLHTTCTWRIYSLRPRQNGRRFADDTFKRIFLNETVWILIKISLKFVPRVPINNIPALVQIMAWRRPGDKPLSEPTLIGLLTHICVTRPQWVNDRGTNSYHTLHINNLPRFVKWYLITEIKHCHRSPTSSPRKGQWRGALMFSSICTWMNGWVNNRDAGDLRRYHTHHDVRVMQNTYYVILIY